MSSPATRVICSTDELEALAPAWWCLWRRARSATPFQSPAWLIPWWQTFAPGDLFTVAVERAGSLIGLAPLYCENGAKVARLVPLGIALSDYLDVLLDPVGERETGERLVACACAASNGWERWEWEELRPEAAARHLPVPVGCRDAVQPQSTCPVLTLSGEDLTECLPRSKRRQLNLARNRAARRSPVVERARGPAIQTALDDLFRLHRSRWESRGEQGVLAAKQVQRFHRTAAPLLDDAGLARFYTLRFGGEAVAAYYGFLHNGQAFMYLTGFSPDYAFESPGTLLIAHAIAEALREGAREFHFLRGQEAYKYDWGAVDRWNHRRALDRIGGAHVAA